MDIIAQATLLFLIMDPLGNIPVFLSVLKGVPEERRSKVLRRELLIAYGVLLFFMLVGPYVLNFLQLSQEAISIGGGIILFLIAIKMIFPSGTELVPRTKKEPLVVPLAIPMISGPSSLAMIMLMREQADGEWLDMWLAISLAWVVTAIILLASKYLFKLLGERGLIAVERLMGMVLIILAVQMLLAGIANYLHLAN